MKARKGFTLIELLIVIGIIVLLAGVVIIALNPARQFALARNSQRWSNVNAILNAVGQRMAENKGVWNTSCGTSTVVMQATSTAIGDSGTNLALCLVPNYLASMLMDPNGGALGDTKYRIFQDSTTNRVTVDAPQGMVEIPGSDDIRVSR
ncbi:MAG: hypothetical protein UX65_C0004G0027 [Parcubacteria group bacterium GW2011_GWB1_46_8]|nr:MAG: hypothetical protein UX65_C0004G0027 [Parcubacteria group bacterium GW2011_GWB1_46_8]KKU47954.1 MAG: hypothetical protein UX66_C0002G0013 [Parcubacteria group bacterium GW2011_GWF2_46_8]